MTDLELMQSIKTQWGTAITDACHSSSVPESFLAALIANESGGDPYAKRFEKGVLASLWEVLLGRKTNYGSIDRDDILAFACPSEFAVSPASADPAAATRTAVLLSIQRLDTLATSWGLTQIMGYHAIAIGVHNLQDPQKSLLFTIGMLSQFAHQFSLDLAADFGELLHCWNAGSPSAPTFDPHYVSNALNRKQAYEALP